MTGIDNLVCALIASPSLRPNFVRKSLDSDLESRNIQMGMRKRSLPLVHFPVVTVKFIQTYSEHIICETSVLTS